jgi:excisionase family DNA binding protein
MGFDKEERMPTTTPARRLLKASEVAALYGLHRDTIRQLVADGKLQSVRIGEHGWHRFRVEDVERFIAGEAP